MPTATLTRKPRTIRPAICDSQVIRQPLYHCELRPDGVPGVVQINGVTYTVTVIGHLPEVGQPVVEGYTFRKEDGTSYDVGMSFGLLTCDCADQTFNRDYRDAQGCKHCKCVRKHFVMPLDQMRRKQQFTAADFEFDNP
jgi:hypothetical protein